MNIPESIRLELGKALLHSDGGRVIQLIESNRLSYNSLLDEGESQTLLHEAVLPLSGLNGGQNQIEIIDYLIRNGANINAKNKRGFSPLHVAIEYHSLTEIALIMITKGNPDINSVESNGNNLIFTAIREYGKAWRVEDKGVSKLRLEIIEELLKRGANLDKVNNHGISSRRWQEVYSDEKLNRLIQQYE